jgi:hypothetical protein
MFIRKYLQVVVPFGNLSINNIAMFTMIKTLYNKINPTGNLITITDKKLDYTLLENNTIFIGSNIFNHNCDVNNFNADKCYFYKNISHIFFNTYGKIYLTNIYKDIIKFNKIGTPYVDNFNKRVLFNIGNNSDYNLNLTVKCIKNKYNIYKSSQSELNIFYTCFFEASQLFETILDNRFKEGIINIDNMYSELHMLNDNYKIDINNHLFEINKTL